MTSHRATTPYVLLALLLLTPACAGQRQSAGPMEPGTYSFNGSGRASNQFGTGQEHFAVVVMGRVELLANGAMIVSGTSGNCSIPPTNAPVMRVNLRCNGTSLHLTPTSGSAEVPTEVIVSRRTGCARYEPDEQGRSTNRCVEHSYEQRTQRVRIQVPLVVARLREPAD
jgi:hypothetical protein